MSVSQQHPTFPGLLGGTFLCLETSRALGQGSGESVPHWSKGILNKLCTRLRLCHLFPDSNKNVTASQAALKASQPGQTWC